MEDFKDYPSWHSSQLELKNHGYRIHEEKLANAQDKPVTVVIGDKVCDTTDPDHDPHHDPHHDPSHDPHHDPFCDGPLAKGTVYSIWVFVCNSEDCTSAVLVRNITTASDANERWGQTQAIVAGVTFSIFILGGIVAAWYFCFRSKSRNLRTQNQQELSDWKTLQNMKEPRAQRPMKLISLENIICKKQRDDCLLLREEYEDIVQSHTDPNTRRYKHRPHNAGVQEINRTKNRYNDIVTYDHSRVKLSADSEGSNYINANFIPGYKSEKDFIATQGPLPFTISDFWRMVWEHNVSVIVMLTLPKEGGKVKCEQYWPAQQGEVSEYEDIQVTNVSTSSLNDYSITIFSVCNCKAGESARREVRHFHYLKWKDMTASVEERSVLEFQKSVRQYAQSVRPGPVVVHCSAGVGRTGAFIALDFIQQAIAERTMNDSLDIYGFVMRMRKFRCNMVQTEDQYIFIHQCARVLMSIRRKREAEQGEVRLSYAPSTLSLSSHCSPPLLSATDPIAEGPEFESCVSFPDSPSPVRHAANGPPLTSSREHLFVP